MGEENKEEGKKEEEKKAEEPQEIVLKVYMHCEACARKIAKALTGFQGVEEVMTDYKSGKVVVKGKTADPIKVCERVQKKSGRKVELVSPLLKPPEKKKEESQENKKEEKKDEVSTIVLKVDLGCLQCYRKVQKILCEYRERYQIQKEISNEKLSTVTVSGLFCPKHLAKKLCCKAGGSIKYIEILDKKLPEPLDTKHKPSNSDPPPPPATDPPNLSEPSSEPIGVCCRPCYEGYGGGPCHEGYGWPSPCYCDGGYGRQRMCYDGYGRPTYVCSCKYFSEEYPTSCTIM